MSNFEKVYLESTEIEKSMGLHWYADQHNYLKDMSAHFDVPLDVVCGITAALSPMVSWQLNLNMVYHVLKFEGKVPKSIKMPGIYRNVQKAFKIYRTKKVFPTLSGPKVTQFYLNLLNPFDDNAITIDTFMLACYADTTVNIPQGTEKRIKELKYEVKMLSMKYALLPCQFQAIVWLTYHRIVKSMGSYGSQLNLKIF